jgi:signal transduction histidine kinase
MERITMMSQLLSGVVHKINNPLAIAMGNVGLLKDALAPGIEHLTHVMAVELAIDRTATAVRRFAQLTRAPAEEHQTTDLNKVLGQVIELRSREWKRLGISAIIDLQPAPPLDAQKGELELAFLHLLINAEEAAVRNSSEGRISVRAFHDVPQHRFRIEVEDSGPGIPEAAREEVFTPFYTTKADSTATTGLGLTMVRDIVERHRGRVWFETTKGQGTTFIVELPSRPSLGR